MPEDKLTKDDLVLLMESYRNMIIMHQTILDQSSKSIDILDSITKKQDNLFSKQDKDVDIISTTLENSVKVFLERLDNVEQKMSTGLNKALSDIVNNSTNRANEVGAMVSDKLVSHEKKSIEDHAGITNKIQLGWVGMGTIMIGLIGLIFAITNLIHTHPIIP